MWRSRRALKLSGLHDLLVPVVDRVIVCDRRGEATLNTKADQADADHLSELLRRE
jgi:hypothetical protein